MNPTQIVPHTSANASPIIYDAGEECSYCNAPLTTEVEMMNQVCLMCMTEYEREAKIAAFDELVAACRGLLHIAPAVACNLHPTQSRSWNTVVERIRNALIQSQWF